MVWSFLKRLAGGESSPAASHYSALRATPSRPLPRAIADIETGPAFSAGTDKLQAQLLAPPDRPDDDAPMFFTLTGSRQRGLVTMTLPEGGRCLVVFTSFVKANDYREHLGRHLGGGGFMASSARELLGLLQQAARNGIDQVAFDRCPRCNVFMAVGTDQFASPDDVLKIWAIIKSSELARAELYLDHAFRQARSGHLEEARDVALETAGHVTSSDPRVHLLLGELGVALGDQTLTQEAAGWLQRLQADDWHQALQAAVASDTPTYRSDIDPPT